MGQRSEAGACGQCPPLGCQTRRRGRPAAAAPEASWQEDPRGKAPWAQHAPGQPGRWQGPAGGGGVEGVWQCGHRHGTRCMKETFSNDRSLAAEGAGERLPARLNSNVKAMQHDAARASQLCAHLQGFNPLGVPEGQPHPAVVTTHGGS